MLDSKKIIIAITKARMDYKKNELSKELVDSTDKDFWDSQNHSEDKKNKLIDLAKSNAKRPVKRTDILGNALCNYTSPKRATYDADFTKQIKELAPHWFKKSSSNAKSELIELAEKKSEKPISSSVLYKKLVEYTNEKRSSYDPEFNSKIRSLAPHWFVDSSKTNKSELLEMAKNGAPRPRPKLHRLGYVLEGYCKPSSNAYDPVFSANIKELAPHWFRS